MGVIGAVLESRSGRLLFPGDRYWELLKRTVTEANAGGELLPDAQIVAVCREHGVDTISPRTVTS